MDLSETLATSPLKNLSKFAALCCPVDGFVGPFECQRRESPPIVGLKELPENPHSLFVMTIATRGGSAFFCMPFASDFGAQTATKLQQIGGKMQKGGGAHNLCSYVMFRILGKCKRNKNPPATQKQTQFYDEPLSSHYMRVSICVCVWGGRWSSRGAEGVACAPDYEIAIDR